MSARDDHPEPLRPLVFQVLLLLNESELHGYAIMQAVNENAGRNVILGPATLYRTLKELRDAGLIEECDTAAGGEVAGDAPESGGRRRRVYRLTEDGKQTARAEAERMAAIVDRAKAGRLI